MSNHINAFMELNEKLSEIDITMKDELLVIMLLSSLPAEFEHFVIAIETRDSLSDFSTVKQKLLEEGNRRKEKGEKEEEQADTQKAFAMENKKQKEHAKQHLKNSLRGNVSNAIKSAILQEIVKQKEMLTKGTNY